MTFEYYYNKYFDSLVYFANRHTKDEDVSKDLVQDVFERVWRGDKLSKLSTDEPLVKSYLYSGVYNACVNHFNYNKESVSIDHAEDIESSVDIVNDYIRMEFYVYLYKLINELSPECRKIINLYYKEGFTSGQIARMLGLHKSTVKNQLARGLQSLKGRIENKPPVPVSINAKNSLILMFRQKGVSGREIGEIMGMKESNVWTRYKSILKYIS